MRWHLTSIVVSLAVLTACGGDWNAEDERFAQTYAEILVARELYPDTARGNARVRDILQRSGYGGEEEFRHHFVLLARDPVRLRRVFDSAAARAQRMLADSLRQRPLQR
jgi:hypothetical protein